MKLEFTVKDQTIHALSADHLNVIEKGDTYTNIIDLRKSAEMGSQTLAETLKEKKIPYNRYPVSAETLSEQDVDHVRWEFARRSGPYAVLSSGGTRAAALVIMHAARTEGWEPAEALKQCPEIKKNKALTNWIKSYISRHKST